MSRRVVCRKQVGIPFSARVESEPAPYIEGAKKSGNRKTLVVAILLVLVLIASAISFGLLSNYNSERAPVYPPGVLDNYALSLINADREANGLQNVTLSSIDSAQEHADDMLKNGYFSHWDLNGYKPYMRYTLAGGQGAVDENCAWEEQTGSSTNINVESALKNLEWNMMYNDSASNWGHRDNILNPLHNEVNIGIAYDSSNVYFVEDFENDYISWNALSVNNNHVTMQGTIYGLQSNAQKVEIFYDDPHPLTVNQLKQAPYNDGYDQGTYVGSVLPPPWQSTSGITINPDIWSLSGNSFEISFSLSQAIAAYGNGVYTLYLYVGTNANDYLTTYSIWITST